jgi:hypothetical protein
VSFREEAVIEIDVPFPFLQSLSSTIRFFLGENGGLCSIMGTILINLLADGSV